MAKAAKAASTPRASGRSTRATRSGQRPAEIGVKDAKDAPTQLVQKRKAPVKAKAATPAKKRQPVAKKSAAQHVPPIEFEHSEFEEEFEEEPEEESEEEPVATSTPKKSRKSAAQASATDEQQLIEQLKREADALLRKAQSIPNGLNEIQRVLKKVGPARVPATATPTAELRDSPDPDYDPATDYQALKHHPKVPKVRKRPTPWSEDEEKFLIKLICERGPKWSEFETNYSHRELFGRNQTALKDKARNIMRGIIDSGSEEQWLEKYPMWARVTVGAARRGVHAYEGRPPVKDTQPRYEEMLAD